MITINARGARTLADTTPLRVDGQKVYVTFEDGTASLHMGGKIVDTRTVDAMSVTEAQDWAYEMIETLASEDAPYELAAEDVRNLADTWDLQADSLDAKADAERSEARSKRAFARVARTRQHAMGVRRDADLMRQWTAKDEHGYTDYLVRGLGDTDGYYAPMDRAAWKRTLGA